MSPFLFVDPALHAEFLPALWVVDGQVILALPGHLQSGLLQSQNHALAIRDPLSLYKRREIGVDAFPAFP
ncbi:MAG: hypothetical protein ABS73_12300 [Paracoccus sp. SCN 68-21]|nr:MAG: hypothetical protein ABS73_12300 [Paracoccus sp. SCN 68-21]